MVNSSWDVLNLFFPKVCRGCNQELISGEDLICTDCRHNLPLACFHRNNSDEMRKKFYGRVELINATSLLYFEKKGLTQKFIHGLKYKGEQNIGAVFGKWLGEELSSMETYKTVEGVIPVPLHKKKFRKRGYNQVTLFAKAIAEKLQKPYIDDVLIKVTPTPSQVFKARFARLFSSEEIFSVQSLDKITGKHLLLVDDVMTTGATLEACSNQLLKAGGVELSIATIAVTQ